MVGKKTEVETLSNRRIRVTVSRQIDYAKAKIEFFCEGDLADDQSLSIVASVICEELEQLAEDKISVYDEEEVQEEGPDEVIEEGPEEVLEEEVLEEVPPEEVPPEEIPDEEVDITEADINAMTKAELVELCKGTEGMEDIDLNLNLKPLRAVILDLLFEEEGEEEGEAGEAGDDGLDETGGSWEQDEWQDQ